MNFPSFLPGFAGQRLHSVTNDRELAMATVRAWNDWHIDEWAGPYPDRIIPSQIPWLLDPDVGADDDPRERGARASRRSRSPSRRRCSGCRRIHSGYWDPFIAACDETETVINLHIGSSGTSPSTTRRRAARRHGRAVLRVRDVRRGRLAVLAVSRPGTPNLKICMSEGGIGWVAGLLDRLDHMLSYHEMYGTWTRSSSRRRR